MLQKVNKRSYWALEDHISVDILDKAFKNPNESNSESSDSDAESENRDSDDEVMVNNGGEEESKNGGDGAAKKEDNSRIPLDPARLKEFNMLEA